jgi:hypothetical protein
MPPPPDLDLAGAPGPPDFVGVGSVGSGTGWWLRQLLAHPEIRPPQGQRRALHHFDRFCDHPMTEADIAEYHARFPRRPGTLCGEWTPRYMFDAWTPPLLKRAAPDAKLLVLVSDPIERYRAIFTERRASRGKDERFFMADAVERRHHAQQLARLRRFYDPGQILVLQYERCRREPEREYRRTLAFLGVRDLEFVPRGLVRKAARRPLYVSLLLKLGLPPGAKGRLLNRLTGGRPIPRKTAQLWPDLEAALHIALDPDVEALSEMVPEFDLSLWKNFAHLAGRREPAARAG